MLANIFNSFKIPQNDRLNYCVLTSLANGNY